MCRCKTPIEDVRLEGPNATLGKSIQDNSRSNRSSVCFAKNLSNVIDFKDAEWIFSVPKLYLTCASADDRGFMQETSKGCILWVQCGGRQMMCTPFARARFMASIDLMCVACPSRIKRDMLDVFEDALNLIKCCSHQIKDFVTIQPLLLLTWIAPTGAPRSRSGLSCTLGKRSIGGIMLPSALTQSMTVVFVPFSLLSMLLTWFYPLRANIFGGWLGTVVAPFSSQLKILLGWKKWSTLVLLHDLDLAMDVFSGSLSEISGSRHKNPYYQ